MPSDLLKLDSLARCQLKKTGMVFDNSLSKPQWEEIGECLHLVQGSVGFWIGDWLKFGEKKWGEMYEEAEKITGLSNQTLRDNKWVAENVDLSCRNDKLSHKHHRVVAPLKPDEQKEWLGKAETENLSSDDLRKEVKYFRTQCSGENEWYTPSDIVDLARQVLGVIELDPASSLEAQKNVMAEEFYTKEDNGLEKVWKGKVWLNPPYAQPLMSSFVSKLLGSQEVSEAVMITHNYTDTAWFHEAAKACSLICFTRGRVKFIRSDGFSASPTNGQCIFYFGENVAKFKEVFEKVGIIL